MLIFYLLLILLSWAFFDIVQRIVLLIYHVKISTILDSIDCKEDLLFLKSKDFEYVIAEVFKRNGHKVRMSDRFGEGGNGIILDDLYYVLAKKDGFHHLIEVEQAKKLIKHMQDDGICKGMIVTLGNFKQSTEAFCYTHVIKCINGNQLLQMCKEVRDISPVSIFAKRL